MVVRVCWVSFLNVDLLRNCQSMHLSLRVSVRPKVPANGVLGANPLAYDLEWYGIERMNRPFLNETFVYACITLSTKHKKTADQAVRAYLLR